MRRKRVMKQAFYLFIFSSWGFMKQINKSSLQEMTQGHGTREPQSGKGRRRHGARFLLLELLILSEYLRGQSPWPSQAVHSDFVQYGSWANPLHCYTAFWSCVSSPNTFSCVFPCRIWELLSPPPHICMRSLPLLPVAFSWLDFPPSSIFPHATCPLSFPSSSTSSQHPSGLEILIIDQPRHSVVLYQQTRFLYVPYAVFDQRSRLINGKDFWN